LYSSRKLEDLLGWKAVVKLDEGLKEMLSTGHIKP
jgi:nucleoside-diphosphate-sugar epimerase